MVELTPREMAFKNPATDEPTLVHMFAGFEPTIIVYVYLMLSFVFEARKKKNVKNWCWANHNLLHTYYLTCHFL